MFENTYKLDDLSANLGSWWTLEYQGSDQIVNLVAGEYGVHEQLSEDMRGLVAATSRLAIRSFREVEWQFLELVATQRTPEPADPAFPFEFPVDPRIVSVGLVTDQFDNAGTVLVQGRDFQIRNGNIAFSEDPFNRPFLQYSKSTVEYTSTVLQCWGYSVSLDTLNLVRQYGAPVGLYRQSSEDYKTLLNILYDNLTEGPTDWNVLRLLGEALAVPIALETGEVVQRIEELGRSVRCLITDRNVYLYGDDQIAGVSVGSTLAQGQILTDGMQMISTRGVDLLTYQSWLTQFFVELGYLEPCFKAGLIFRNAATALILTTVNGRTKISWDMPGDTEAVAEFFTRLHDRGLVVSGRDVACLPDSDVVTPFTGAAYAKGTLAHFLDYRAKLTGEPSAATLPATLNPIQVLFDNVFGNNMMMLRAKILKRLGNKNTVSDLRLLKRIMPPGMVLAFVLELGNQSDSGSANDTTINTFTSAIATNDACSSNDSLGRLQHA